jgi:hypothetical protein
MLKAERISQATAQRLKIIVKHKTDSGFHVDVSDGAPVAWFEFAVRSDTYRGMVFCTNNAIKLDIINLDGPIPAALHRLKDTPAEFRNNARDILPAEASYIKGEHADEDMMQFRLKGLTAKSFSGNGLMLWSIDNPEDASPSTTAAQAAFIDRIAWADQVTAFTFVIRSKNAENALPAVLKACNGS